MSAINKIPRGLRVLIVIAVLGALVWKFAINTNYYYYSIGIAVLITIGMIFAIYHTPGTSKGKSEEEKKNKSEDIEQLDAQASEENAETGDLATETISVEEDDIDISAARRRKEASLGSATPKPNATDVAAMYRKMAEEAAGKEAKLDPWKPAVEELSPQAAEPIAEESTDDRAKATEPVEDAAAGGPPIALIDDESTLTEEEKNELVNAVWCRCENPYCRNTNFLGVHHIVDEKDGGDNKLDNLIVLCPYCHDLAHKNEIPEKEMRGWIINREERFKFKPEWHYH